MEIECPYKNHKKYSCDQCDKTFKYEDTKEKHIKISHENLKIYCHYYNNEKECPFDDDCVYLHEDSVDCKYGDLCERDMCMFKHESCDEINEREEDNDDEYDDEDGDGDTSNRTFINPLLTKHVEENETDASSKENNEKTRYQSVNGKLICRVCKQHAFMCNC